MFDAAVIQGMTAVGFGTMAYSIKAGDTVLVHAAAGGTGQLLTQANATLYLTLCFLYLLWGGSRCPLW